jgi:carbonic anhydrase
MTNLVTRRGWLQVVGAGTVTGLLGASSPAAARGRCPTFPGDPASVLPSQADDPQRILEKLLAGNARYIDNDPIPHNRDFDQGLEIDPVNGQRPAAMVLSCADSRVVPELIFDQPRARLFVCRVAGNFATDEIIGSLEYGVRVLGAKLLIVMGHSSCGAVTSTIALIRQGPGAFPPDVLASKIPIVLAGLRPPVERVIAQSPPGTPDSELLRAATDEVARENAALLRGLPPILQGLDVVATRYDIDTGVVNLL